MANLPGTNRGRTLFQPATPVAATSPSMAGRGCTYSILGSLSKIIDPIVWVEVGCVCVCVYVPYHVQQTQKQCKFKNVSKER